MLREQQAPPIVARQYRLPFALIAALFFAWALAAGLNDVLIRQFQKVPDLTRTQASFIQMTFYIGSFCAAIPAALVNRRLGYKATMLSGLLLYATGASKRYRYHFSDAFWQAPHAASHFSHAMPQSGLVQ